MPASGITTVTVNHSTMARKAGQRQRPSGNGAMFSPLPRTDDVALRVPQQAALQIDQRRRDGDDDDHDHGHQLVGRHAELVGELVEIGREHQHALRIAEHQRQAEQFEAEEEHQRRRRTRSPARTIGRLTSVATFQGSAPVTRAASSRSVPRLRSAAAV